MHSLASVDAGTQTDEDIGKSGSRSPEKKVPSPMVKETEHVEESDESDTPYDDDEHAEIETAVPVVTRARVVSVQKPIPPSLPPRNPGRVSTLSPERELNDGFDQVDLNGSAEATRHHEDEGVNPSREEGRTSNDGTVHGADDDFHSIPATPIERRDEIPGSFE
jgi:hypothetical protein